MDKQDTTDAPKPTSPPHSQSSILETGKNLVSSTKEAVLGLFTVEEKKAPEEDASGKKEGGTAAAKGESSQSSLFDTGKSLVVGAADTGKKLVAGAADSITGFLGGKHSEQIVHAQVGGEKGPTQKCTNPACSCVDCKSLPAETDKKCQNPNCSCVDCACAASRGKKCGNALCECEDCACEPGACNCGK